MPTLLFRFDDAGEIKVWGEEVPNGIACELPADWALYSINKYIWNGTALVARDGWVDPVQEPAPTE